MKIIVILKIIYQVIIYHQFILKFFEDFSNIVPIYLEYPRNLKIYKEIYSTPEFIRDVNNGDLNFISINDDQVDISINTFDGYFDRYTDISFAWKKSDDLYWENIKSNQELKNSDLSGEIKIYKYYDEAPLIVGISSELKIDQRIAYQTDFTEKSSPGKILHR